MYRKIIVTQGIIEVMEYEKLNVKGGGKREGDGAHRDENYRQRQQKRRNMIRRLICQNFDRGSKFVTLTMRDTEDFDVRNVKECNAQFKLFIHRLRRKFPDIKYVSVIEFQDKNRKGVIHYHMVCNLPYVKKSELAEIWGLGWVKINRIDHVDNIGAYVVKYMTEDTGDTRLCGENAYLRSQALEQPLEACTWRREDTELIKWYDSLLKGKTPSYGGEPYESEHAGTCRYSQYNMNRTVTQDCLAKVEDG